MNISVRVFAGAPKSRLVEEAKRLVVYTRAPARNNLANEEVCRLIAEHYGCPKDAVRVIRGNTYSSKVVTVVGIEENHPNGNCG